MIDHDREMRSTQIEPRKETPLVQADNLHPAGVRVARHGRIMTYGIPRHQKNLSKYFSPAFFEPLDNPYKVDLYGWTKRMGYTQDEMQERGANTHILKDGGVIILTDHARDFAMPGFLDYDEDAQLITGSETLVAAILENGDGLDPYTHVRYNRQQVPLFRRDGSTLPLHQIFDTMPNPVPPKTSFQFHNRRYLLDAKVLPIPAKFTVPQLSLIGPAENNNLDRITRDARPDGGRIVVAFKKEHAGLANGFIRAKGNDEVYELLEPGKKRAKRKNGNLVRRSSVEEVKPGQIQYVLIPINGDVEDYVRQNTARIGLDRPPMAKTIAVFGIDVVESGRAGSEANLVPINFRQDLDSHVPGETILDWYSHDHNRYLQYVRENSIMPVQPVVIKVRRNVRENLFDYVTYGWDSVRNSLVSLRRRAF